MPKRVSGVRLGEGFPGRLRQLREAKVVEGRGVTQGEAAAALKMSRNKYSRFETGAETRISLADLLKIKAYFEIENIHDLARKYEEPYLAPRPKHTTTDAGETLMNVGVGFPKRLTDTRFELEGGKGLTQQEFAIKVGVTRETIQRLETGKCLPSEETFFAIVEASGKDAAFLYGPIHEDKLITKIRRS